MPRERVELAKYDGTSLHTTIISGNPVLDVNIAGGSITVIGTEDINVSKWGGTSTTLGQKAMTASVPVVLASDQSAIPVSQSGTWNIGTLTTITNVVHVDDNSASLTVDNAGTFAVQATQSGTWNIGTLTTITNVVHVDDNSGSLTVDNNGTFAVQSTIAAAATNIAKAEDAASANADVGVPAMAIRKASPANTSDTDGDYEMLQMSAGRLWVDASGVSLTVGTHAITIASGGVASGAIASGAVASGAFASGSISSGAVASGAIASGAVASGAFASGSISAGAVAAGASSFVHLEDDASGDTHAGVGCLAVRKATPANTSGTDGDYEFLQMSAGRIWASATIDAALPAGTNAIGKLSANSGVDIGDVDVTSIVPGTAATNLGKAEDDAHNSGDVGVMALAVRKDTPAAFGADGDYAPLASDSVGRLHTSQVSAQKVATPTLSNVSASASSVTLLSSNTSRRQVFLVNDSTAICYVKFGTTASATDYTVQMAGSANSQVAMLILEEPTIYTGRIDAIWASATGTMRVTEIAT